MDSTVCNQIADAILDARPGVSLGLKVEGHVAGCADCHALLEAHLLTTRAFAPLRFQAPDRVWRGIQRGLQSGPAPSARISWIARLAKLLLIVCLLVGADLAVRAPGVKITYVASGTVRGPGGLPLAPRGELALGGAGAGAGGHPSFTIDPGARLTLHGPVASDRIEIEGPAQILVDDADRVEVAYGRVTLSLSQRAAHAPRFAVRVPAGEVRSGGGEASIEVRMQETLVALDHGDLALVPDRGSIRILDPGERLVLASTGIHAPSSPEASGGESPATAPVTSPPPETPIGPSAPLSSVSASLTPASPSGITSVRPGGQVKGGF